MSDLSTVQNIGKYSINEVFSALQATLEGTIASSFALNDKEKQIVREEVKKILAETKTTKIEALPLPVESELANGNFTRLFKESRSVDMNNTDYGQQATPQDWAEMLNQLIVETFSVDPFVVIRNLSALERLMRTVIDDWNRKSEHLPTTVRHVLNANRFDY